MKNSIKSMRYIGFILVLLTVLSSCDSREDWFAREGEDVAFVIKTYKRDVSYLQENPEKYDFRTDTVYSQNTHVVTYDLKVCWLRKDVGYGSGSLGIDIDGVGQKVGEESGSEWSISSTYTSPQLSGDYYGKDGDRHKEIHFVGSEIPGVNNDTVAILLNTANIVIELRDAFRNKVYCHVKVNLWSDIPPIPVMEVSDVIGYPMEKVLSLSKSYDKDGSVIKYEYCIDGNVRDYNYPKFEIENDYSGGKGAYGGTYITSTDLNEIKHAFQTEGEHIVYYRCMDNLGLWSVWNKVTVTIK